MAEAGELGHWEIVQTMSKTAGEDEVAQLADWAVEIQREHGRTGGRSTCPPTRGRRCQLQRPPSDHRHEGMALIKLVIDARKTRETGSVGGSIR